MCLDVIRPECVNPLWLGTHINDSLLDSLHGLAVINIFSNTIFILKTIFSQQMCALYDDMILYMYWITLMYLS